MVPFAVAGIAAWAVAGLVVLLFFRAHEDWLWTCVAGFLLGFPGLFVMIRHDANRRRRRATGPGATGPGAAGHGAAGHGAAGHGAAGHGATGPSAAGPSRTFRRSWASGGSADDGLSRIFL
jgi:hypothetical protein